MASERMGFCASVTHSEQNIGFWHRALGLGASVNQSERAFYVVAVRFDDFSCDQLYRFNRHKAFFYSFLLHILSSLPFFL